MGFTGHERLTLAYKTQIAWRFSGDASDSSGHGRNGSVVGATLVADRHGNPNSAYEFADDDGDDNGDGYIRTAFSDRSPNPGDTFAISVSLWSRADWSVENVGSVLTINADSAVAEVNIEFVNGANLSISSGGPSRVPYVDYDAKLTVDAWTHFAAELRAHQRDRGARSPGLPDQKLQNPYGPAA